MDEVIDSPKQSEPQRGQTRPILWVDSKNAQRKSSVANQNLYVDLYVVRRKGIFEYLLGGKTDPRLLQISVFDEAIRKAVYAQQTATAEANGEFNCPLCALGHDANRMKIWPLNQMDADHVQAWSAGGATDISNCQMLCKTHNRAKGNR